MKSLSLTWGVLSIVLMALSFVPCFSCMQWPTILFASIGIAFCGIAMAKAAAGDRMSSAIGIGCCAFAILLIIISMSSGDVYVYDPYWP